MIKIEGDRLYWRENLEGNGWGWYPIHSGPGLLEGFVRLTDASPEAICTFARRWGVLRICHHGLPATHNPRPPELPAQSGIATWCYPLRQSGWYWEPLDIWHDFARRARAVLNLAAAMGQKTSTRREDWAVLHDTWAQRWDASGGNVPVATMHLVLEHVVNTWLVWGHVCPMLEGSNHGLRIELRGGGLFGAIAVQLLAAVSRSKGWAVCINCGDVYSPLRRPKRSQRTYCHKPECKAAAIRDAMRDYRARRRIQANSSGEK
jgi:hypothetical protein